MKKIFFSTLAIGATILFSCCNREAKVSVPAKEIITFYDVPLVCNAAPDIGCGSRSKPALLELEKNPVVKEAWLNRKGTVIGIAWKDSSQTEAVAKPIFDRNSVGFSVANDSESKAYSQTFRKEGFWYKGTDVDKLSLEEAGVIANRYITLAVEQKWITTDESKEIEPDLENYFKTELVKVRTLDELNNDSRNKFREGTIDVFEKHIGKEKSEKVIAMYNQWQQECEKREGCCKRDTAKSCCSKK